MDNPVIHDAPPQATAAPAEGPVVHSTPPPIIHDAPPMPTQHVPPEAIFHPSPQASAQVDGWIRKYSDKWNVPYGIARSLIFKESSNNPNAPDTPGGEQGVVDVGLGQVGTDVGKSEGLNVRMPEQNVAASMEYLSRLYHRFQDWPSALSAYNAGPGNVSPHHPASFTHDYVTSIMGWADAYNKQLAESQRVVHQAVHQHVAAKTVAQQHGGFADTIHSVVSNIVGGAEHFAAELDRAPNAPDPRLQAQQRAYEAFGHTALGKVLQPGAANVMQRVGTVGEVLPEVFNAEARNLTTGQIVSPNGLGSQALRATLLNPNLTLSQKLDAAYNELGINSPGELSFWAAQPGIRESILSAIPTTPGGALVQLMLGGRADLARYKQSAPHLTGLETFGLELVNPTLPVFSKAAKLITRAVAKSVGVFADAAATSAAMKTARAEAAAAHARQAASDAGNAARNFQYAPTKSNVPMIPQPQHATPLYDQFAANPDEYLRGPKRTALSTSAPIKFEHLPGAEPQLPMPLHYTQWDGTTYEAEPEGLAYKLGKKFGYKYTGLATNLGKAYSFLSEKLPGAPIIGDRYLNYARVYGPQGEFDAANFVARHAQLRENNINNLTTPELYGGLNQRDRIQMHITVAHLPQYLSGAEVPPPDIIAPRTGGSLLERALRVSNKNYEQWKLMRQYDPDVARYFVPPQLVVIPHGMHKTLGLSEDFAGTSEYNVDGKVTVGKAVHVVPYAPQLSTWARQDAMRTVSRGGHAGLAARPATVRRVRTMDDAISGNAEISQKWNPAGDMVTRWNGVDHYLEFMYQLKDVGSTTIVPHLGVPATMPIEYEWPGAEYFHDANPAKSVNFKGAFVTNDDGTVIDLAQPRNFGRGREGFENYKKFEEKAAQVYAQAAGMKADDPGAAGAVYRASTRKFADAYPEHELKASENTFANAPGLKGYAVERNFLHQVMDANPRVRYNIGGGATKISAASLDEIERAFSDLKDMHGDTLDWKNMTAKELAETHFRADSEDEPMHALMAGWDFFNAQLRTVALSNFLYHPLFNSYPAMLTLLLEHAGMNPLQIGRYGVGLTRALGMGWYKTGDYFLKEGASVFGKSAGLPSLPTWLDINPKWLDRAQEHNVFSHGFGMGIRASDYVRLMSFPTGDLPFPQKMIRASTRMQEINKTAVFDIQEANMLAYAHHVLVDELHMDPRIAAREINKAVNDYSNLTGAERTAGLGRVLWFYPWFRMQMHRAWNVMKNNPQIPAAYSSAIYRNNQAMGDKSPNNTQVDLFSDGKGGFQKMSASASTYRYPVEFTDFFDAGIGNTQGTARAIKRTLTSNLSPFANLATRGIATVIRHADGADTTPNDWDATSGMWDWQQPFPTMVQQAAHQFTRPLIPYGMFPSNYDSQPGKVVGQMRAMSETLRKDVVRLNREGKYKDAQQVEGLITRLDNQDVTALHAAKNAEGKYSTFFFTPHVRGGGGF